MDMMLSEVHLEVLVLDTCLIYPISTSYSNVKDAFVYTYVPFDNSSVEDGQWFNIYGNFGVSSITLIGAGVGFPWGFSLDIAGNISEHETNFRMQFLIQ